MADAPATPTTHPRVRRAARRSGMLGSLVLLLVLVLAAPVHAAEGFSVERYTCTGYGGGDVDAHGVAYLPCGAKLEVVQRDGTSRTTTLDIAVDDLAPNADGSFLWGTNGRQVYRFARQADGSYRRDGTQPELFPYGGRTWVPQGIFLDTDAFGNLYVSNGTWVQADTPAVIVKYGPDGRFITHFGDYASGPADSPLSWADGKFRNVNTGVSASWDGTYVYTVEMGNSRVQRFRRQGNGHYAYDHKWGNSQATDPARVGRCVARQDGQPVPTGATIQNEAGWNNRGMFAAPYDIGVDPWGFVHVLNTTCGQLSKFTADGGHLSTTQLVTRLACRPHGLALDGRANAYAGQCGVKAMRTTPVPTPFPAPPAVPAQDVQKPVIDALVVPRYTATTDVEVTLRASDNVGITQMRVINDADDQGNYLYIGQAPWQPFQQVFPHRIRATRDTQAVIAQVRDAAGNVSDLKISPITLQQANPAPQLISVTVPEKTALQQVRVVVEAQDDSALDQLKMRVANDNTDIAQAPWVPFRAAFDHEVSAGTGAKSVRVQLRDPHGNTSAAVAATTLYDPDARPPAVDRTAPTITAVRVPADVKLRGITVRVDAVDNVGITQMRVVNEADDEGRWIDLSRQPWVPYQATFDWTLSPNADTKAVILQVRDAAGNVTPMYIQRLRCVPCDDGINEDGDPPPPAAPDTVKPVIEAVVVPAQSTVRTIRVKVPATDNVAIKDMRVTNESDGNGNWYYINQAPWQPYRAEFDWLLSPNPDTKAVAVQVRDTSGNISDLKLSRLRCVPCAAP